MRKTITTITVLATLILFLGCVKENDEQKENNNNSFNPPAWIQGTWVGKNQYQVGTGFKFKKNDICGINFSITTCFGIHNFTAEQRKHMNVDIKESISDTEYIARMTSANYLTVYHFKKISDREIEHYLDSEAGGNLKARYVRK